MDCRPDTQSGHKPVPWAERLSDPKWRDYPGMVRDSADWGTCPIAEAAGVHHRSDEEEDDRIHAYMSERFPELFDLGMGFHTSVFLEDWDRAREIAEKIRSHRDLGRLPGRVLEGKTDRRRREMMPEGTAP